MFCKQYFIILKNKTKKAVTLETIVTGADRLFERNHPLSESRCVPRKFIVFKIAKGHNSGNIGLRNKFFMTIYISYLILTDTDNERTDNTRFYKTENFQGP
jgi:hypothetical protein